MQHKPQAVIVSLALLLSLFLSNLSLAQTPKDPSLNEIYQAAQSGNVSQAVTMVDQVLVNHPNSAKAHYVAAEVYAKAGKTTDARLQLEQAEKINPSLNFVKPDSVSRLKSQLGLDNTSTKGRAPAWMGWLLAFGLVLLVVATVRKLLTPRPQPSLQAAAAAGPYTPNPYGAGYPPPATGGMGSGIMSGLTTGAAVGAGIVVGEALMHKVLDGNQSPEANHTSAPNDADISQLNKDMGGENFGFTDSDSWENNESSFSDSSSDFTDNSSDWS